MDKKNIVKYLANIVFISRIDGKLSPHEEEAIECAREEVGAKKGDLNRAIKSVELGEHEITPVGRFSDKIRNLEDMIFIAISDRELAGAEKNEILEFAKLIEVSRDQLTKMLSEAKVRLKLQVTTIKCPSCREEIASVAKFCPHCGANTQPSNEETAKKIDLDIPQEGLTIEFAESTSASFGAALTLAKSQSTFQECTRAKKRWYCVTWPMDRIIDALDLERYLGKLRNRRVYVDGNELPWEEVFGFRYCAEERQQAYRGMEYCFGTDHDDWNIWGCSELYMGWGSHEEWLCYGSFQNENEFVFDKKRIWHELEKRLNQVRFCPFLDRNFVEAAFNLFPEKAEVSDNGQWEYSESYYDSPGSLKITVEEEYGDGYKEKREIKVDGVSPKGYKEAKRIITTASEQVGAKKPDFK